MNKMIVRQRDGSAVSRQPAQTLAQDVEGQHHALGDVFGGHPRFLFPPEKALHLPIQAGLGGGVQSSKTGLEFL